jgi:hypothetical protein
MVDGVDVLDPAAVPLEQVPTERLEAELMTMAGHLAAAMCSFLLLVAEFDRRDGASEWECLSTAHWLNWRCGVGMTAAREQVRVARRLGQFPVLRAEFAAGRLSYSKVRAITRVVTPEIEVGLVRMAQHATAAQMDRACRALRRTQDLAAAEAALQDEEEQARERQHLSWSRTEDGDVVLRARLCAEDAETVIAALRHATEDPEPGRAEGDGIDQRRADALVELSANYLAQPEPGEGASPEIVTHLDAAAAVELARRLAPPAGEATASATCEGRAGGEELDPVSWPVTTMSGAPLSWAALERLVCDAGHRLVARLPDGSQLDLGRHQRTVNRAQRRALLARDKHCRFPGCHRRSRLRAHHIVWWSRGGPTDMDNLLMLCPKHHRDVHEGGWSLTGTAADPHFVRPDGRSVEERPPILSGSLAELVHLHQLHGRDIVMGGAGGHWTGEHIDWDCFFAAFAN